MSALRDAVESWARGRPAAHGPLEVVEALHGPRAAAPDPELLTLHLPENDHRGLVEAVVGVDVVVHGEHLTRLRWRRTGRSASSDWRLVDVRADGQWRSEAWCLHPRVKPLSVVDGVTLVPLALHVGATGWMAAAEVDVSEGSLDVRWDGGSASVSSRHPVTVVMRGPAGTAPTVSIEVAQSDNSWRTAGIEVAMAHGHPREGWCDIPDPLPAPRPQVTPATVTLS